MLYFCINNYSLTIIAKALIEQSFMKIFSTKFSCDTVLHSSKLFRGITQNRLRLHCFTVFFMFAQSFFWAFKVKQMLLETIGKQIIKISAFDLKFPLKY